MTAPDTARGRPRDRFPDNDTNPQVTAGTRAAGALDVFHTTRPDHPGGRQAAALTRIGDQLGDRDRAVLHVLAALRLATTHHVQRLVFATGPEHTRDIRTRRCLGRLRSLGLVDHLVRPIGGPAAGSTSHAHYLTRTGQRIAQARPTRNPERVGHAQAHTLATTELAVALWEAHQTGALELVHFEAEPASWRTYTAPDQTRRYIRPDAFVIVASGAYERLWFIEQDRGTQGGATLRRKATAYHDYATSGHEQAKWSVFPRVAYLTPTPERARAVARALAPTPDADQLVTVAPTDDAVHTLATTPHPNPEEVRQ